MSAIAHHAAFPDALRTDVPTFDLHHQWLIILLRHTRSAVKGGWQGFVRWSVDYVDRYLVIHNQGEEYSMRNLGYPQYDAHRIQHQKLMAAWAETRTSLAQGSSDTGQLDRFTDILLAHIGSHDQDYAEYFRKEGASLRANNLLHENDVPVMPELGM